MIDTHVHFWNYHPVKDAWINEDMGVIRKDFAPKNLMRVYSELQIEGCIAVQASQTEDENKFLLDLAAQSDLIKGIVGWIDLKDDNLTDRLNYWHNFKLIKGWRHILQAEKPDFFKQKDFISGLKALKDYQYTYDLLIYHNQFPELLDLVAQIPDQALVLDHCGKPDVKQQNLKTWANHLKILAQNPNVYCKISGLLAEADWKNWTEKEIFNCFDVVFEHFTPQRVLYGSDWPVMLISRPYDVWFKLVYKYTQQFTQKEQKLIFGENAKAFYRL